MIVPVIVTVIVTNFTITPQSRKRKRLQDKGERQKDGWGPVIVNFHNHATITQAQTLTG